MKLLNVLIKIVKGILIPISAKIAVYTSAYYGLPLMLTTLGPIPTVITAVTYIIIGPEIVKFVMI
jgi:hypothetical protein